MQIFGWLSQAAAGGWWRGCVRCFAWIWISRDWGHQGGERQTGGRQGDSLGSKNRHYIAIFSYWLSLIFTDIVELCTPIHGSTSIPTFVFCNEYSDQILKSAVSNIFKVLPVLHYSCPVIIITLLKVREHYAHNESVRARNIHVCYRASPVKARCEFHGANIHERMTGPGALFSVLSNDYKNINQLTYVEKWSKCFMARF